MCTTAQVAHSYIDAYIYINIYYKKSLCLYLFSDSSAFMYHVSVQGVDERMINAHYYYYHDIFCCCGHCL